MSPRFISQLFISLCIVMSQSASSQQSTKTTPTNRLDFDMKWNYNDPAATENVFREYLPAAEQSHDKSYLAQLLTQLARTHSLRGQWNEANALLDRVDSMLTPELGVAHVRSLLERGRTLNSSGHPDKADPLFREAFMLAESIDERFYAVDAAHMVAIAVEDPEKKIEWNLKGIALAKIAPEMPGWLISLYNNIGECYSSRKEYVRALDYFEQRLAIYTSRGKEPDMYDVKDVAKMQRLLGHPDSSAALLQPIYARLVAASQEDGWIFGEYAEALHALGRIDEARPLFSKAYVLLSQDDLTVKNETEMLARWKQRGDVK